MNETVELDGLTFEVRRSARRRTLTLTVDRGGQLVMHAPQHADRPELAIWAGRRLLWVHRTLAQKEQSRAVQAVPEYVAGEAFRYLGKPYPLALVGDQAAPLVFDGRRFLRHRARRGMADLAMVHRRRQGVASGTDRALGASRGKSPGQSGGSGPWFPLGLMRTSRHHQHQLAGASTVGKRQVQLRGNLVSTASEVLVLKGDISNLDAAPFDMWLSARCSRAHRDMWRCWGVRHLLLLLVRREAGRSNAL